jgi:hypothetical protein
VRKQAQHRITNPRGLQAIVLTAHEPKTRGKLRTIVGAA